jgi:hypothetical protein
MVEKHDGGLLDALAFIRVLHKAAHYQLRIVFKDLLRVLPAYLKSPFV